MTDWKGIAMVVNQLSQLAEPSKLDLLEREYEMKSVENEADRQHTFLLKAYDTKESQLSDLRTQYKKVLKEGQAISSSLPGKDKDPTNYSGNIDKILNDVYGGMFTNYQAGIQGLQSEIDKLESSIVDMNAVNDAATLGSDFFGSYKTPEDTYIDAAGNEQFTDYAAEFDINKDGDMSPDEITAATDAYVERNYQGEENKDLARAFKIGVNTQHDYQQEQKEMKEIETAAVKMSEADKLEWEIVKNREKYLAKEGSKVKDAHGIIPELEKRLISKYGQDETTGGVNWDKVLEKDADKLEWQNQMKILAKAGESYIYAKPNTEITFSTFSPFDDDPADAGYTEESYYQAIKGIDKDGKQLDRDHSAWLKKEYEWLVSSWKVSEDSMTPNPIPGKSEKITVKQRRAGIKSKLKQIYDIGI